MKTNLPVLVLNNMPFLPTSEITLEFDDETSKNLIDESEMFHESRVLVIVKVSDEKNLIIKNLPRIGTISKIKRKLELPNGKFRIVLKGLKRANVIEYLSTNNTNIEALIDDIDTYKIDNETNNVVIQKLTQELTKYVEDVSTVSNSILSLISKKNNLSDITDLIVNNLQFNNNQKLKYLFEINPIKRTELILNDIYKEKQLYDIEKKIDIKIQEDIEKDQKDYYIKEKIKLLQDELSNNAESEGEISLLKSKLNRLNAPSKVKNKIFYEISRYESMNPSSLELSFTKKYIDYMLSIPWNVKTKDEEDISKVKKYLEKTHYGLSEVKNRILEYLAIKKISKNTQTPIICLVGPPGVGKTTIAKSIADSMNRKFCKISVGGVDDEAIIKGHVRTYLGSSPGKIIAGIKDAQSSNPVFLIDEIDKMSSNYKGDPVSALLEVLDSTQNKYFKDNYIEEEYDLSNVLFILTANDINILPKAFKDRLEIININGYTIIEKINIIKKYVFPKLCEDYKLKDIKISENELIKLIKDYTHETGVRQLTRLIDKITRNQIVKKVTDNKALVINIKNVEKYLGQKSIHNDLINNCIGVVNCLSVGVTGGDIVQVESGYYKGNGSVIITGLIGDSVRESSTISISYIKSNYKLFNIDYKMFSNDIHINFLNNDLLKDGTSGGVAITTSIISLLSNLRVSSDIAFTGEITLNGNIQRVGSIKEKIIGAYANNIKVIFIPESNVVDIQDLPADILNKIKIIPVSKYVDIYKYIKEKKND